MLVTNVTIVERQVDADARTDLTGIVHTIARSPSYQSFKDCVTFHLLTVFPQDATEQERYYVYVNVHLKKPTRVFISHFVARVLQLNIYLGTLPGVYDSPKAIAKTKNSRPSMR